MSAEFKMKTGLVKKKKKNSSELPTRKEYKQQVLHAQYLGDKKFVVDLIVRLCCFHKSTYRSLRKALLALLDQLSFYRVGKLCIPLLSFDLDKLDWNEVGKIIQETFWDPNLSLTVFTLKTPPEGTASSDHNSATDIQKAQTTHPGINQLLRRVLNQSRSPCSHIQSLPHYVWKLWILFHELTIPQGMFCRKY